MGRESDQSGAASKGMTAPGAACWTTGDRPCYRATASMERGGACRRRHHRLRLRRRASTCPRCDPARAARGDRDPVPRPPRGGGSSRCAPVPRPRRAAPGRRGRRRRVCVPPSAHAPVALAVLDAGKHLLVENPCASISDHARRWSIARRASVTAMVGFNLRFHAGARGPGGHRGGSSGVSRSFRTIWSSGGGDGGLPEWRGPALAWGPERDGRASRRTSPVSSAHRGRGGFFDARARRRRRGRS